MTGLRELQNLFWRAITWPTGVEDFLAQLDDETRRTFEAAFGQTDAFGRNARMQVYAEAYFWRLFDVLKEQFPITAWWCGPERFHNLVTDYVLRCPSSNPDIRRFGDRFAAFADGHETGRRLPGLGDVARIEWAILDAVDGPDDAPLRVDALANLDLDRWPSLRLRLRSTTLLLPSRVDFSALFAAQRRGDSPPRLRPESTSRWVLIWRRGFEVFHRTLPEAEAEALTTLMRDRTFADACAGVARWIEHEDPEQAAPTLVAQWLRRWIDDELLHALA